MTVGSMHKHLTTTTKKCGGYLQGKLRDLGLEDGLHPSLDSTVQEDSPDLEWSESDAQDVPYEPFY